MNRHSMNRRGMNGMCFGCLLRSGAFCGVAIWLVGAVLFVGTSQAQSSTSDMCRDMSPVTDSESRAPRGALPPIGVNLPDISDYMRTPVYVDLMHRARRFGSVTEPWDESAFLAEDGWPIGDFGVVVMTAQRGLSSTAGTYTLTFEGQATVGLVGSKAELGRAVYDARSDRTTQPITLYADTDNLILRFVDTADNIKNIRIVRPGYSVDTNEQFTRAFLDMIDAYPVLRFMDWLHTNNNPVKRWVQRTDARLTHTHSKRGVSWETVIDLIRLTGKDPWVNVPAMADDEYIEQLAMLLKACLPASSVLYVEYSNEVWNAQFQQHQQNLDAAVQEAASNPQSPLIIDGPQPPDVLAQRRIVLRAQQISEVFKRIFGEQAFEDRVRVVYATQVVNPSVAANALAFMQRLGYEPQDYFFALAGAPYFNLGDKQTSDDLTTTDVIEAMQQSVNDLPRVNRLSLNAQVAKKYSLHFVAYEGGSDTFGPGSIAAKRDAGFDPRMQALCQAYLQTWRAHGGQMMVWYTAGATNWDTPFGTWGLTNDIAITDTPKTRCLKAAATR